MIKNIIFDIDGTLWDTTGVVARAWNKALDETGLAKPDLTAKDLQKEFGKPMDGIFASLFPHLKTREELDRLEKAIYKYEHAYVADAKENLTYEGVVETIKELSKTKKLYIVSNCQDGYIEVLLKKLNLSEYIKDYDCYGKTFLPKSGTIRLVCDRNALNNEETVYVGDTMGDYNATKDAGLKFVFASYGFGDVKEPDMVIGKFSELLSL
ncbi:MAG: HAD family hydrolase [Lachnospiraceae bacterium]|nr:HAD family hydrolase [Lachnospiraceae bacterium]